LLWPVPPAMFTFPLTSDVWSLLAPVLQPWTPSQDSLNIHHVGQLLGVTTDKDTARLDLLLLSQRKDCLLEPLEVTIGRAKLIP